MMSNNFPSLLEIARLCQFAYKDDNVYADRQAPVEHFDDRVMDTQGFFLDWDEWLIICFRGTDNDAELAWNDLILNLRTFTPYGSDEGRGGWGFYASYSTVREQVLAKARDREHILCCGHSLGGALAIIAAVDIVWHTKRRWQLAQEKTVICRTIGCPRIGDKVMAQKQMEFVPDMVHFVGRLDIVTIAPPWRKRPGQKIYTGWHRHSSSRYVKALSLLPDV